MVRLFPPIGQDVIIIGVIITRAENVLLPQHRLDGVKIMDRDWYIVGF